MTSSAPPGMPTTAPVSPPPTPGSEAPRRHIVERAGLFVAPALMIAMLLMAPPAGMTVAAWRTAAVALLMAIWWITESVPIPVTALIPLVAFPVLGITSGTDAAAPYANPIIYLFLGGFVIAIAIEHSGLHRRLALAIMSAIGTKPTRLILGMLVASAFISMWISNAASTMMMLPLAMSILAVIERDVPEHLRDRNFAVCLILVTAHGSTIGGVGTLIGTPPTALLAAHMHESYGLDIGFGRYMMIGVPLVLVSLPLTWLILTRFALPIKMTEAAGGREIIAAERRALGRVSRVEWTVGLIAAATSICWITRPLLARWIPGLTDTTVAMAGALAIFLVPVSGRLEGAITWKQAERLPWAVLVLFGGGLSLANAVEKTKLAEWVGSALEPFGALPLVIVVLAVTAIILFLSELTSNTAIAATFLPVAAALAGAANTHPLMLAFASVLGASLAFMLPVGTPPNAIVYATGRMTVRDMIRAGFLLNLMFVALITIVVMFLVPAVFDVTVPRP